MRQIEDNSLPLQKREIIITDESILGVMKHEIESRIGCEFPPNSRIVKVSRVTGGFNFLVSNPEFPEDTDFGPWSVLYDGRKFNEPQED